MATVLKMTASRFSNHEDLKVLLNAEKFLPTFLSSYRPFIGVLLVC